MATSRIYRVVFLMVLFTVALFHLAVCQSTQRIPQTDKSYIAAPSRKGAKQVSASYTFFASDYKYFSVQAAYSPLKNIGVAANFSKTYDSDVYEYWKVRFQSLEMGWYSKKLKQPKSNHFFLLDVYIGTGWGKIFEKFPPKKGGTLDISFGRHYLRPRLHFGVNKYFAISMGLTLNRIHYLKANLYGIIDQEIVSEVNAVQLKNPHRIAEPFLQLTGGFKRIKALVSFNDFLSNYPKNTELIHIDREMLLIGVLMEF